MYHPRSRSNSPRSPKRATAAGNWRLRISRRRAFDVLPQVTHSTFGGGPSRCNISTKSLSLVITTAPAARAAWKIGAVFGVAQPQIADGVSLDPERRRDPRGGRRGQLGVEPKDHATGSGSDTRRLAKRRHAWMSAGSRIRQFLKDLLRAQPAGEQVEYVANADAHAAHARAAAALFGVYRDPICQGSHSRLLSCLGPKIRVAKPDVIVATRPASPNDTAHRPAHAGKGAEARLTLCGRSTATIGPALGAFGRLKHRHDCGQHPREGSRGEDAD